MNSSTDQFDIIPSQLHWRVQRFDELSNDELYRILRARVEVFVVEQNCPYAELDGLDGAALHVSCLDSDQSDATLLAYARILPAGHMFDEVAIGRVLTVESGRGLGLGRVLMRRALDVVVDRFGSVPVRISAQQYLERFYASIGFVVDSDVYLEDGIPHLQMVLMVR
ncbi:MAG: GNAT family N-acetyltransferase [Pseudomonadota bacterium]